MTQPFTMSRRVPFVTGVLALLVVGASMGLQSARREGRTSLLLKCDPADGLVVLDRLHAAVRLVAASADSRPPLRVLRMDVKSRSATLRVWVSAPEDLDALVQTLTQDAVLSSRRKDARWVRPGAVKRVDGGWEQAIDLHMEGEGALGAPPLVVRFAEALGEGAFREGPFSTYEKMNDHLTCHRGKMTYASAKHVRQEGACAIVTQKFGVDLPTLDQLMAFLRAIDGEPGIVIEEVSWSYDDEAEAAGRLRTTQIRVSAMYPRPFSK